MKANEKLDVATPSLILEVGRMLYSWHGDPRVFAVEQAEAIPVPEQVDSLIWQTVAAVNEDSSARKMLGLRPRLDSRRQRMRVAAVGYLAWKTLRAGFTKAEVGEVASVIADPKRPAAEGLILARHELGRLIRECVLIGGTDTDRPVFTQAALPTRTLTWLSGGAESMGFLTHQRLERALSPEEEQGVASTATAGAKPPPTARQLFLAVRQKVIGCDPQLRTLASRISLGVARAEMLARGVSDNGVGNQCLAVFGSSGTGKTHAVEQITQASGLVFASFDASGISGLGWAGSSVEDALKVALQAANGNAKKAANSIIVYDELDKVLRGGQHEHRQSAQGDMLRILGGHKVVIGGKRNHDCPPTTFDCAPTIFVLSGVFQGLAELAGRWGRLPIGFNSVEGEKSHTDMRHALQEYGCLPEVCNRVSCFIQMPNPTAESIATAVTSEHGIVQAFNRVLASRNIVLAPQTSGVRLLADYGVTTRTYFRGVKHLIGSVVEGLLFDEATGTVVLDTTLIRHALDRAAGDDSQPDAQLEVASTDSVPEVDPEPEAEPLVATG